ncbi:MAG: hypothetical protein AAB675_02305 [Patescibacteria group bacterium]
MKDYLRKIKLHKKKVIQHNFLFVPIFLVTLLLFVVVIDIFQKGRYLVLSLNQDPNFAHEVKSYPLLKNRYEPFITAQAALIIDKESKVVLYEKNKNLRFSPASTTKIMTALVGLDNYKLDDVLEVKDTITEGSVLGLFKGQRITFGNLLYAMMLPSANDAATAIAQNYPGGENKFIDKMNEEVKKMRLKNTHFDDPAGLLDKSGFTTAIELSNIASIALDNKIFAKVVSTPQKHIYDDSGFPYFILNKNKLLGIEGVNGIKTGFTEEAGDVLVTSRNHNDHTLIIVVLRSQDRFADTYELLRLINSENLTYLPIRF